MARKSKVVKLNILLQGNFVGQYTKNSDGSTIFQYSEIWVKEGFPISQRLPLVTTPYKGDVPRAYFENLLPDLKETREAIASKLGAKSSEHFDLLTAIGHDCVGALLFTEREDFENFKDKAPQGNILNEKEIEAIIKNLKNWPLGMEANLADFRISLAGAQEKTALLFWKKKWRRPIGVTPTTHIIKPPMSSATQGLDMSSSVHNEYFCMKLCQKLGLNTANVELKRFGSELVLNVERFDRLTKNGIIYRKAQEDFCQALGYFSNKKYQSDGGPAVKDFVSVLEMSVRKQEDLEMFFKSLVIFFLIGAIDGHAKNYSIEYVKKGHQLAPLYDILSIFPALTEKQVSIGKYKLALSLGNSKHYSVHKIRRKHLLETALICHISERRANEIINEILSKLDNEIWNEIEYSELFEHEIKDKIISGIKIVSRSLSLK